MQEFILNMKIIFFSREMSRKVFCVSRRLFEEKVNLKVFSALHIFRLNMKLEMIFQSWFPFKSGGSEKFCAKTLNNTGRRAMKPFISKLLDAVMFSGGENSDYTSHMFSIISGNERVCGRFVHLIEI